jgi:hypothetical protein
MRLPQDILGQPNLDTKMGVNNLFVIMMMMEDFMTIVKLTIETEN